MRFPQYKNVRTKSEVVNEPHFAVLRFTSVHIPGDERSRTNPGHGYPAENKPIVEYLAFVDADELAAWIVANEQRETFAVIEAKPRNYTKKVTIDLE